MFKILGKKARLLRRYDRCKAVALNVGWYYALKRFVILQRQWQPAFRTVPSWQYYNSWSLTLIRIQPPKILTKSPLCFYANLGKMQPHFALLKAATYPLRTYSFGSLLRLYLIQTKRTRRDPKRLSLAMSFFQKYFSKSFKRRPAFIVLNGYKKRYSFFIHTNVVPFARRYAQQLIFLPQTLRGFFLFRRVKGVKKRIRKRLQKIRIK